MVAGRTSRKSPKMTMIKRQQDSMINQEEDRLQLPKATNARQQPASILSKSQSTKMSLPLTPTPTPNTNKTKGGRAPTRSSHPSQSRHLSLPLVLLIIFLSHLFAGLTQHSHVAEAQFLFTYEINQESDDSRAPKSSLFDPSSFKIVTPSQLQSSYQKLASQQPEQVAPISTLPSVVSPQTTSQQQQFQSLLEPPGAQQQQPVVPPQPATVLTTESTTPAVSPSGSFLKQTSAAIQSFAELFHLAPSSSPTPLGASSSASNAPSIASVPAQLDQQAEARSLHEHWTQQQQKAHHQASQHDSNIAARHHQQHQSPSAFQSFTTSPSVAQNENNNLQAPQQQQQPPTSNSPAASYWLTSNPLNGPDGNFLVEIKTGQGQQNVAPSQQDIPANSLVDSLLSLGQPQQPRHRPQSTTASSLSALRGQPSAQSSFLSTPASSYFPQPQVVAHPKPAVVAQPQAQSQQQTTSSNIDRFNQQNFQKPPQQQQHFQPQSQALHQHQARSLSHHQQQQQQQQQPQPSHHHNQQQPDTSHANQRQQLQPQSRATPASLGYQSDLLESHGQLQPPANTPEQFGVSSSSAERHPAPAFKSAEESLLAFRQQQQSQHDQQSALLAAQNQFASQARSNGDRPFSTVGNSLLDDELGQTPSPSLHAHNHQNEQEPRLKPALSNTYSVQPHQQPARQQPQQPQHSNEVPKVSPQIYESFLLQQKDQYEKHMELLKQQQELNKLLEQKQQQDKQEADKRKRKKEELERSEARKKAQAAAAAREQEQRERKLRLEAEELRRKQARQQQEEEEKRRREAEEERRYRELLEAREREEKRKRQKAEELLAIKRQRELKEQQEREALLEQQEAARRREHEAAKYRTYLKQQEELKKLLELKQREDETVALARQRQAAAAATAAAQSQDNRQQDAGQFGRSSASSRANKLALEHKERARQLSRATAAAATLDSQQVGAASSSAAKWGGRQARARTTSNSFAPLQVESNQPPSNSNTNEPELTTSKFSTPASTTTSTTAPGSVSTAQPRVGARLSGSTTTTSSSSSRRQKADERLIRQKIPLYSGAGKYGLYRSEANSDELAKLLEAVSLPATTTSTSSTTTTTTTTTTQAPTPASSSDLLDSSEGPADSTGARPPLTSSSLSPLLNLRELAVTASPALQASTGEPFSSTTIFDDDVPRRPVASNSVRVQPTGSPSTIRAVPLRRHQPARHNSSSSPPPSSGGGISSAASVTSTTRMSHRMGGSPGRPTPHNFTASHGQRGASIGLASLPADTDNDGIPGRAGQEYPVLAEVPKTSFSCSKSPLNGYFADTETACQVVHLCQDGVQSSILCPNGTIFNQEKFSCQWWYEVNCARAPMFYQLNDNLYRASLVGELQETKADKDKESSSSSRGRSSGGAENSLS